MATVGMGVALVVLLPLTIQVFYRDNLDNMYVRMARLEHHVSVVLQNQRDSDEGHGQGRRNANRYW